MNPPRPVTAPPSTPPCPPPSDARRARRAPAATRPARPVGFTLALRVGGALAVLAVGAAHLQQYAGAGYSTVPVIGPLFAANFAGATVLGLGLLLPLGRLLSRRRARLIHLLLAIGAVGLAAGSLAGLWLSEHGGLFGFSEHGSRAAIVISIAAESATVVLLLPYAAAQAAVLRR